MRDRVESPSREAGAATLAGSGAGPPHHLPSRAAREREEEHPIRADPPLDQTGYPRGECPGLARSRARDHPQRPAVESNDGLLLGIQVEHTFDTLALSFLKHLPNGLFQRWLDEAATALNRAHSSRIAK